MAKFKDFGSYKVYDFSGDTYEVGDDEKCPDCGAGLDGYRDLQFLDGVIQLVHACPECGKTLTFNYYLDDVIVEKSDVYTR